jgi:hypothetical protein
MKNGASKNISNKLYYIISFIEGQQNYSALLRDVPLSIWSSVLGVNLGELALGYFLGGFLSAKYNNQRPLFIILLIGSFSAMFD